MAVPFSNTKLRVPKGFQNILEAFAREVLRSQPENIFEFGCAYFENMMKVRAETGHDPAVHGARLDDRNYNNEGFKRKPCPPEQQQKEVAAAVTVQTQYRQHAAKEEVNEIKEEVAATKIQAGFRGYLDRETVRKMKSESGKKSRRSEAVSDERNSQESQPAEKLEIVNIDLADPEVEKAAMFIQSGFKGFKARKITAIVLPEPEWPPDMSPRHVRMHHREVDEAATKIQAHYRGYHIRKQMNKIASPYTPKTPFQSDKSPFKTLEDKAATKIQAGFRGHLVRKDTKSLEKIVPDKDNENQNNNSRETSGDNENHNNIARETNEFVGTIDVMEPEYSQAALRIQAGFRGLKSRKEVQRKKELRDQQKHQESTHEGHDVTETQDESHDVTETQDEGHDVAECQDDMPDLGDPDVEKAAVKIQAGFKGLKARKELRKQKEEKSDLQDESEEVGESRETTGVAEIDDVENPEAEGTDEVDSRADHAAVKIQAGFRGYKTRKSLQHSGASSEPPQYRADELEEDGPSERDMDHRHDKVRPDPDQAATRIQASYKGYKTRKELKSKTSVEKHASNDEVDAGDQEDGAATQRSQGHVNMDDPEVQKAVVKIQAGFKGMKARQEVKAKIAEKKSLTHSQESGELDEGQVEEEEQIHGSSLIEVSQDEVGENEQIEMDGDTVADIEESEVQETDTLAEDETQGDETQRDETEGDETQRDQTEGNETQRDQTEGDETQEDETQGDEANEQPESLTEEI